MNSPDYGRSDIEALFEKKNPAEKSGSAKIFSVLELGMWSRIYKSQYSLKLTNNCENLCVLHAYELMLITCLVSILPLVQVTER